MNEISHSVKRLMVQMSKCEEISRECHWSICTSKDFFTKLGLRLRVIGQKEKTCGYPEKSSQTGENEVNFHIFVLASNLFTPKIDKYRKYGWLQFWVLFNRHKFKIITSQKKLLFIIQKKNEFQVNFVHRQHFIWPFQNYIWASYTNNRSNYIIN